MATLLVGAIAFKLAKCLFNSVVSTPGAKFMSIDIKDYYLNTPMNRYEYMRIPIANIPPDIMLQ